MLVVTKCHIFDASKVYYLQLKAIFVTKYNLSLLFIRLCCRNVAKMENLPRGWQIYSREFPTSIHANENWLGGKRPTLQRRLCCSLNFPPPRCTDAGGAERMHPADEEGKRNRANINCSVEIMRTATAVASGPNGFCASETKWACEIGTRLSLPCSRCHAHLVVVAEPH